MREWSRPAAGRLKIALIAALCVAAGRFAFGGAVSAAPASQMTEPVAILFSEYAIDPADAVVAAGPVALRLVNSGVRRHNLIILVDGVERASPEVRPGDTVEWALEPLASGRYLYWCGEYRHLEKGMVGALVVE